MQSGRRFVVVFVTAPDQKTARRLVRGALEGRLIACGNLLPAVESHYWWRGKIAKGAEVLILLKTTQTRLPRLERWLLAHHPYDTPEIIAVPLLRGTRKYLAWIAESVLA